MVVEKTKVSPVARQELRSGLARSRDAGLTYEHIPLRTRERTNTNTQTHTHSVPQPDVRACVRACVRCVCGRNRVCVRVHAHMPFREFAVRALAREREREREEGGRDAKGERQEERL